MRNLSVVHISTSDVKGGAAAASYRQHQGLLAAGVDSKILTLIKLGNDDTILQFDYNTNLLQRVFRRFRKTLIDRKISRYRSSRPAGLELFSDDRVHLGSHVLKQIPVSEIINLQWCTEFFDFSLIKQLTKLSSIIVTMHDLWTFTGGCHYDLGCKGYESVCGRCPQLGSNKKKDLSNQILARKARILSKCSPHRVVFVASTSWLQQKARLSSILKGFNIEVIPHGIDVNRFQPIPTDAFRQRLGFSDSDMLVLFVSTGSGLPRKGYTFLKAALEDIRPNCSVKLLTVGRGYPESPHAIQHLHIDHVNDERELSAIYSSADVFIMPSTDEAYGLTALEAMSCGTPVIGFRTGMCVDAITNGENGFVVDVGDIAGLKQAILAFANNRSSAGTMGRAARQYVEKNLTLEMNATRYIKLYETMLDRYQNRQTHGV